VLALFAFGLENVVELFEPTFYMYTLSSPSTKYPAHKFVNGKREVAKNYMIVDLEQVSISSVIVEKGYGILELRSNHVSQSSIELAADLNAAKLLGKFASHMNGSQISMENEI
jgi:hypothetical protein